MSTFSAVLRGEITRLARKECKLLVEPLRKANATQRKHIAELKRELVELRKIAGQVSKPARNEAPKNAEAIHARFSSKGLKSLRSKLGLSANDFGKLIGASGQSVYQWEAEKAVPRQAQRVKLAALRGIGKREALRRLGAL